MPNSPGFRAREALFAFKSNRVDYDANWNIGKFKNKLIKISSTHWDSDDICMIIRVKVYSRFNYHAIEFIGIFI